MTKSSSFKSNVIKKYKSLSTNRRFYLLYTLFFLAISFFVFFEFIINKKTLIWSHDGYTQHLKSAVYISKWIRGTVYNLVRKHTITPDTFSFGLGYGGDVITTLNFYGFGDIIYLPTLYMNEHVAVHYHNFVIFIRYYLAVLSFYALFSYLQKGKTYRVYQPLCGALLYSFCGYAIAAGLRHPQFLMPMVTFPIIVLGLEKLLRENRPNILILSIWVSSMANFILFFMEAVLLVVYFIWRELEEFGISKWKQILSDMIKTALYSILGLALGGGIIVPVITMLVNDTRTSNGLDNYLIYSFRFIRNFFAGFISMDKSENWTFLGFGTIGILSVLYLMSSYKKNKKIFRSFVILTILLFLPLFGYIIYGTSYAGNRWVWVYSLLVSYITAIYLPKLFTLSRKEYIKLFGVSAGYLVLCLILDYSLSVESSFHMIFLFVAISVIGLYIQEPSKMMRKLIPYVATLITIISILGNAYFYTSYKWVNISSNAVDYADFAEDGRFWNTDADMLSEIFSSDSFYRYSGNNVETNASLLPGLSTTGYFWSTSNKYINEYRKTLAIGDNNNRVFYYFGLDERPFLSSLASVYIYEQKGIRDPYGFVEFSETYNHPPYVFLKNKYGLPLGYGYTSTISRDSVKKMDPADLEKLMMTSAVVEENGMDSAYTIQNNDVASYAINPATTLPYKKTTFSNDIVIRDNDYYVTANNTKLTLDLGNDDDLDVASDTDATETIATMTDADSTKATATDASATDASSDSSSNDKVLKASAKKEDSDYLIYLELKGATYKGCSKYAIYKGNDEKYDPDSKYGKDEWKELSTKARRNMIKDQIYYIEPGNVTLRFTFNYSDGTYIRKNLELHSKNSAWGTTNKDFIINAGVPTTDQTLTSIDITFPNTGKYSFDDIRVIQQPVDDFEEKINGLSAHTLSDVDLHKNKMNHATHMISGNYDCTEDSFLCLSIPYSKGWSIYVDGNEQELIRTNIAYMGTYVKAGKHNITLRYETPGLKIGLILAAIAVVLFLLIQVQQRISHEE